MNTGSVIFLLNRDERVHCTTARGSICCIGDMSSEAVHEQITVTRRVAAHCNRIVGLPVIEIYVLSPR